MLVVLASPVTAPTAAVIGVFTNWVGVTWIANAWLAPAASAFTLHVTVCPAAVQPAGSVAVSTVMPGGMLMVALPATDGLAPWLVTVAV